MEETVPGEVRDLSSRVVEELAAERVTGGVHRRKRPRVSDELAEQRIDPVQPEEKREPDRDQKMDAEKRREADADPERDCRGHAFGRLLAAEQVREKDLQPPRKLQRMEAAPPECAGGLPSHRATPKK